MNNKLIYSGGALLALSVSTAAIWMMSAEHPQSVVDQPVIVKSKSKEQTTNANLPDYATSLRISDAEKQIAVLGDQMTQMMDENRKLQAQLLAKLESNQQSKPENDAVQADLPEASDQYADEEASVASIDEVGMMSPEWIAEQDKQQTEYISKVALAFNAQSVDEDGWSVEVEQASIEAMNTLVTSEADKANSEQNGQPDNSPTAIQASMSNFTCRSQLCEAHFQAATLQDLIDYQSQMIDKLSENLPTIVFDVPVEAAGQYTMRAYLAKDGYEFPAVN